MSYFVSNLDDPLRFFKSCLVKDSYGLLLEIFRSFEPENDHVYNPIDDTAIYFSYSDLEEGIGYFEDGLAIPNAIVLTFDQYINREFLDQVRLSQTLIDEKSKSNGYDQDLKLYTKLLNDLTDIQKIIDKNLELSFSDELTNGVSLLLKFTLRKFKRTYSDISAYKLAKKYFTGDRNSNITGFKLKAQIRNAHLSDIIDHLITNEFVTKKTDKDSIMEFFKGNIPKPRIDWNKELSELKFFIDQIYNTKILTYQKGQQWHLLDQVFTFKGENLPENWHRNHNKLKNQQKREAIEAIKTMLSPLN